MGDVVQANIKAAMSHGVSGAFNTGSGDRISINGLVELLQGASGINPKIEHGTPRPGDVRHSLADISSAKNAYGFNPVVSLKEGLAEYMTWAKKENGR